MKRTQLGLPLIVEPKYGAAYMKAHDYRQPEQGKVGRGRSFYEGMGEVTGIPAEPASNFALGMEFSLGVQKF